MGTLRVLLWGLFGYGGPEYSLIYTPNIRYNGTNQLLAVDMMAKMKAKICTNLLKQEEWDALSEENDLKKEFHYEMSATEFFGYLVFFCISFCNHSLTHEPTHSQDESDIRRHFPKCRHGVEVSEDHVSDKVHGPQRDPHASIQLVATLELLGTLDVLHPEYAQSRLANDGGKKRKI